MRNTFKVLFYIKKNAPLRNGWAPIMGRITINGQRTQFSTRLSVTPASWDTAQGAGLRTEQHGRPNQRKAGQYPISHREMLQQALLRAGLRYSVDGQRDVFRRQSQAGDLGRLLQAAQRRIQTHGRRQPQHDHIL